MSVRRVSEHFRGALEAFHGFSEAHQGASLRFKEASKNPSGLPEFKKFHFFRLQTAGGFFGLFKPFQWVSKGCLGFKTASQTVMCVSGGSMEV